MPLGSTLYAPPVAGETYQPEWQPLPPAEPVDVAPNERVYDPSAAPAAPVEQAPVQQAVAPVTDVAPNERVAGQVDAAPVEGEPAPAPAAEPVPTLADAGSQLLGAVGAAKDAVLANEDPNQILGELGGVKDAAGTAMSAMGGDILPYRRISTNKLAEMANAPPTDPIGSRVYTAYGGGTTGEVQETFLTAMENDPKVIAANANGYTDPATGTTFVAGPEAAWEAWVSDKPVWERAFLDLAYDPTTLTVVTPGIQGLSKTGRIPSIIGKTAGVVDDVLALGANQVVGGGLTAIGKGLKATGVLAPTARQVATEVAEETATSGEILGTARRAGGVLTPTRVENLAPGVVRLGSDDPLIPSVVYKTDGRQITSIIDDPTNLASSRPLAMRDHENLLNLIERADPADKSVLMNTGGRQLLQPDATVAKPYLKTLQGVLPKKMTPTAPMRGAVPTPTSGPELLTLRAKLTEAVTAGNTNATRELTLAAKRSNLLPPTTPPTARGVSDAIGVMESARLGTPVINPATLSAVKTTLRGNLDGMGLSDVGLALDRAITNIHTGAKMAGVEGEYLNKVITLSTEVAGSADEATLAIRLGDVLNHEAIHALRHFNLYRDIEWRSLAEMAASSKMRGDATTFLDEVTARYDKAFADGEIPFKLTPEQLEEEAIAEMYRAYKAGTLVPTEVQRNLLEKIAAFFTAIARSLRGAKPGQVLANTESGVIGGRARPSSFPMMTNPIPAVTRDFRRGDSAMPAVSPAPQMAVPYDPRMPTDPVAMKMWLDANAMPWSKVPDEGPPGQGGGVGWRTAQASPEQAQAALDDLQTTLLRNPRYAEIAGLLTKSDGELIGMKLPDFIGFKLRPQNLSGGRLLTAQNVNDMALLANRDRYWYEKSAAAMAETLGFDKERMGIFLNMLAAFSGGAKPEPNLKRVFAVISNQFLGRDSKVPNRDFQTGRIASASASQLASDKFGNFSLTFKYLMGIDPMPPRATIDLQMAHLFGFPDNKILTQGDAENGLGAKLYDFLADYTEGVRDLLNRDLQPGELPWESWQVQAALWVDYRKASKIQAPGEYDDYARWLYEIRDEIGSLTDEAGSPKNLLDPDGKIGRKALMDDAIEEMYGEAASFWRQTSDMTLETRTNLVESGRRANANYERLQTVDPAHMDPRGKGDPTRGQKKIDSLISEYHADQRRAFDKPGLQKIMRGTTGESINLSQLQTESIGSYQGQVSPSQRVPMGAATGRRVLNDVEQTRTVAWSSLGYDQEVGAASRYTNADLGKHDGFSLIIPDPVSRFTDAHNRAMGEFTKDLGEGIETSGRQDYLGLVIDIHSGDKPLGMEQIMAASERHLDKAFDAADQEVRIIPRNSNAIVLKGAKEYQPHIVDSLDEAIRPIKDRLAAAKPAKIDQATRASVAIDEALATLRADQNFGPASVDDFFRKVNDEISSYNDSPGGGLPGTTTKHLRNLGSGWTSLRTKAADRNRSFDAYNTKVESLLEQADARANFVPGPRAGQPPPTRQDAYARHIANRKSPGDVVETPVGSSYSVVRFKAYHGSNRKDLQILTTDPPVRNFDYASSRMGVFMAADPATAMEWLPSRYGPMGDMMSYRRALDAYNQGIYNDPIMAAHAEGAGKIYQADLTLNNAYDMTEAEMSRFYEPAEDQIFDEDFIETGRKPSPRGIEGEKFKQDLIAKGHDGIVVWDVPSEHAITAKGFVDPATGEIAQQAIRDRRIKEVVSFKDVPVYSIKKGQSGSKPTKPGSPPLPGVYTRGSVEEYVGTIIPDADRHVLDVEFEFAGKKEKAWQRYVREQDNAEAMRDLAIRQKAGATLTPKEQSNLDGFLSGLKKHEVRADNLADWSDEAVDHLAGKKTQMFVEQAKGLRDGQGKLIDPSYYKGIFGKALKAYDNFAGFRRTMSLYSTTRGPAYILMQAIGNAFTLGIADPASLRYYSLIEQRRIVNSARGKGPTPHAYDLRNKTGLGQTESLGASRDQLTMGNQANKTFFEKSTNPVVKGIGKIIASPRVKENADGFDTLLRHGAYRSAFEPGHRALVQELPDRAARALAEASARSGIPSPIRGDVFADTVRNLGPYFSGAELRKALVESAPGSGPVVSRAAERVARDYINDLRTLDKAAIANVNRVGFDFAETRADAVLSRVFMFHYWMSRASVLYLREAASNPWQMQAWSRAMHAANQKVEAGIPEWQKNWQEFMATPAGITGLWNPVSLIGTFLMMREDQEMMPWEDLTKLGQGLQTGFLSNGMLNPLLQAAIYITGGGGSDFNPPDLLGTGKWTGDLNTWLEKANRDVATFYATEKGSPKVVPNIDGRTLLSWVADQITQRGWEADFFGMAPVSSYDPNTSEQANMAWFVQDQILQQNPALDDGTEESAKLVASMVEEALANPDSDLYQAAADNLVTLYTTGPGSGRGNAFLDIAGYYGRQVLPFQITTQVTSRREKQIRSQRDEGTALDKEMGYVDDATPEGRKLSMANDAVQGVWTPAASQLKDIETGIKNGTLEMDAIMIEGKAWTNEELLTLPQADRDTLAKYWLTYPQSSLGGKSGREILNATYAEQDEVLEQYPEIKDYRAFDDYLNAYPGGPLAGIEDTAAVNANYRRFLEGLPKDLTEAEYVEEATSYAAFHGGIQGIKLNRYDANPMASGKGRIAGIADGESLSEWQATSDEGDDAYLSKTEKVKAGLETFDRAATILNGYDTLWGMAPGTLANQYAAEIAGGGYASDQIYGLLKDGGMSDADIRPRTDEDKAAPVVWYLKWATENGVTPGEEVDRYAVEDDRRYYGEKVADINAGIYSDPTDPYVIEAEERAQQASPNTGQDTPYIPPAKEGSPVGNMLGGMVDAVGNWFGNLGGHNADPPVKPTVAEEEPIPTKVNPAPDGIGLKSDPGSDRTWMEDMIGPWHAAVSVDYKGPKPQNVDYSYQNGHAADGTTHAAYDISCDDPNRDCVGTPMTSPIKGKVVCAGYGAGTGEAIGSPNCTYSQGTTLPGQAHTIVVEYGTDPEGNRIQLSFNHMGTSEVDPGQELEIGDPLGTMGDTDAGPHVHLEGWAVCPGQGYDQDWVIVDPHLVVTGYYDTNSVCP